MPRYAYQKPRAKVYAYNFGYMNNYYKPMTHYLEKEPSLTRERPGAQSLAERLKTFPMDGTVYSEKNIGYRSSSLSRELRSSSLPRELESQINATLPVSGDGGYRPSRVVVVSSGGGEERRGVPLYLKHPYRLAVEDENSWRLYDPILSGHQWDWDCIWVPPHESTVTPHFGVEGYRNLIEKFLRLKPLSELTLT